MSVELDPPELGFRRPFTREVTEVLHLRNRNDTPVAFKVKTTAPKQYCVRPNSGRIAPGASTEIQVLLQAMKEDPPADAKCRDKFLVQSTAITPELDSQEVAAIWTAVEKTGKEAIKERKIRVSFLPATAAAAGVNGASSHDEHLPAYSSSPNPNAFGSPQPEHQDFNTPSKGGESMLASATSQSHEALVDQLDKAKSTIAALKAQLEENTGLRQRKGASGGSDGEKEVAASATATKPAENVGGVSVQIVAVLCLLSFLLAYFFF